MSPVGKKKKIEQCQVDQWTGKGKRREISETAESSRAPKMCWALLETREAECDEGCRARPFGSRQGGFGTRAEQAAREGHLRGGVRSEFGSVVALASVAGWSWGHRFGYRPHRGDSRHCRADDLSE